MMLSRAIRAPAMRRMTSMAKPSILGMTSPVVQNKILTPSHLSGIRHAGTGVIGCGLGTIAVGGCAMGIGGIFHAMVSGLARNPSMKEDLFTYTLIGMGMIELMWIGSLTVSMMLLYSE